MIHHYDSIFDLQLTNSSQILNSIKSQAEMCAPSQHWSRAPFGFKRISHPYGTFCDKNKQKNNFDKHDLPFLFLWYSWSWPQLYSFVPRPSSKNLWLCWPWVLQKTKNKWDLRYCILVNYKVSSKRWMPLLLGRNMNISLNN